MDNTIVFFVGIILVAILIRVILYYIDKNSISVAVAAKGCKLLDIQWAPFSSRALFERSERSYKATFSDEEGKMYVKYCKTSFFTGVYWRD